MGTILVEDEERENFYTEFKRLGIPTDALYLLTNPALKQLLDSIKMAIASYKAEQQQQQHQRQ